MNNKIKNRTSLPASRQGGFLQLIIFIVVVVFLMSYFHISLSDIIQWFRNALS